jgi:hypothetical protein
MPIKREIIYPFFLECCEHTEDNFWESIFEDLAYGKTPYGTYISKNFLICGYKGKEFNYRIERKDPKILYSDIYKLLTERLGILSCKEKTQKKIAFSNLEKDLRDSRNEWSSIRKKNVKDLMIENFVIDKKNRYHLSIKQARYLLSVIFLCLMFKTITSKDIIYKDGKIQDIAGINFEDQKILFERPLARDAKDVYSFTVESTCDEDCTEMPHEVKYLSENWERYLKILVNS